MTEVNLGGPAFWVLAASGILSGLAAIWVFRRWSASAAIGREVNRILAHLIEFRLFFDEPALILRAQRDLLFANARLLRLMLRPSLILGPPFAILLAVLGAFYGRAPLVTGDPAVVTLQMRAPATPVVLRAPPAIEIETPGVRVPSEGQISWRLRPARASLGELQITADRRVFAKSVASGRGLHWLSERSSFSDPAVAWIEIRYPHANVFHVNWLVWFLVGSAISPLFYKLLPSFL